jgi:hypothetical protein
MSPRLPGYSLDEVAQKWRILAERRCAHFLDLHRTGRWKHYYSEEQLLRCMYEADRLRARWAEIAPPPADAPVQGLANRPRRTAA